MGVAPPLSPPKKFWIRHWCCHLVFTYGILGERSSRNRYQTQALPGFIAQAVFHMSYHMPTVQHNTVEPPCADTGGCFGCSETPPTAVCNFLLLVDLPRALQQFGSAPEIPVRNPPSECTKPPLLNPGSAPEPPPPPKLMGYLIFPLLPWKPYKIIFISNVHQIGLHKIFRPTCRVACKKGRHM